MPENSKKKITAADALKRESPLVLIAQLEPVGNLNRFQPAGFPEVGHVIYKAPRADGGEEQVCIVDSAASMANHLESICMRGAHDLELVEDLAGMPYLRCVTGDLQDGKLPREKREVVVTSLTEGHRIASTYFFGNRPGKTMRWDGKGGQRVMDDGRISSMSFGDELAKADKFGIECDGSKKAHPPAERWWNVFKTILSYDANALVHGVLFPQWQIKLPRVLAAHLEAVGATRVDRSGVKFDRLGITTSGQPIFAVDDATAREIRATFILDLALVRSFGRQDGEKALGLTVKQKEFLVALAFWKIQQLLAFPFRFRSGCHLRCVSLKDGGGDVELEPNITNAIARAGFVEQRVTDIYWPREELYRKGRGDADPATTGDETERDDEEEETETDA